ncbi:hypothetical protein LY78DRAFT_311518 [Colletotrichum sublineola]|nr:hypothetical protein LY78DRAFT_311518 [Colletotrichum sublineola]
MQSLDFLPWDKRQLLNCPFACLYRHTQTWRTASWRLRSILSRCTGKGTQSCWLRRRRATRWVMLARALGDKCGRGGRGSESIGFWKRGRSEEGGEKKAPRSRREERVSKCAS